ncbi:MAG: isochorismate synthase [Cyanobacteria bacterium P01_A01_bin.123]
MPVVPHRLERVQNNTKIFQFLKHCYQQACRDHQTKLASFAIAVDTIDPLMALNHLTAPNQRHFYYENSAQQQAMVAVGAANSNLECLGGSSGRNGNTNSDRFLQASHWIEQWRSSTLIEDFSNCSNWTFTGPQFFCSFTFFEQSITTQAPFSDAYVMLPQFQLTRQGQDCWGVFNLPIAPQDDLTDWMDVVRRYLTQLQRASDDLPGTVFNHRPAKGKGGAHLKGLFPSLSQPSKKKLAAFRTRVVKALNAIEAGVIHKVVLAHRLTVEAAAPFELMASLQNLRCNHPDCYLFSVSNGQGQTFIGASPERLLSISSGQLLSDALAGSAPRGTFAQADAALAQQLLQSAKERHEHRLVVEFIAEALINLGLSPKYCTTPGLLQLANIQHLHTPIRAQISSQTNALQVLAKLHPTPAVAGVPRDRVWDFIRSQEPFERSLYAAPLGWIDHQGNCEFIVGIRSALLEGQVANLYAGAGIVAGSDPDKEVAEIQLKLRALLEALSMG